MTNKEILTSLGAKIGSKLIGTDEDGTDTLEILGFEIVCGEELLLAKCVNKNGKSFAGSPCNWTLTMREWELAE